MTIFQLARGATLTLSIGDITKVAVDAIVNAANVAMLGGGGVDGAIHRAAGRELYRACLEVDEVEEDVRCPTGEARITPGFRLPSKHVIHTVGPIYRDDEESEPLLRSAHLSSLRLAHEHGLKSIAFPAISCGVYGYPIKKAARVAIQSCADFVTAEETTVKDISFILYPRSNFSPFMDAAREILGLPLPPPQEGADGEGTSEDGDTGAEDEKEADGDGSNKKHKGEGVCEAEPVAMEESSVAAKDTDLADAAEQVDTEELHQGDDLEVREKEREDDETALDQIDAVA